MKSVPPLRSRFARSFVTVLSLLLLSAGALGVGCSSREGRLEELRLLQDAGRFPDTVKPLRELLVVDPENAEARYMLGIALIRSGQPSLAVAHLRRATRSPEFSVRAGLVLASTLQALATYEEALSETDRILLEDPGNLTAIMIHAHAALGAGQHEQALADAEAVIEADPEGYQGLSLRAVSLTHLERFDEAEAAYELLAQSSEEGPPGLAVRSCLSLGRFYAEFHEDEEHALAHLAGCVERYADDPATPALAMQVYDAIERPDQAIEVLRTVLEREPDALAPRLALADRLILQGDTEEAEQLVREAAEGSGQAGAWAALAKILRGSGDLEGALAAIEDAITGVANPSEELLFERAAIALEMGDLDRAEAIAEGLAEEAYRELVLGRVLLDRGDAVGALPRLDRSVVLWPNNAPGRIAAARAALELGDLDRAASELREAVRLEPEGGEANLHLARVQLMRGDLASAAEFARRHSRQGFTGPEAHLIAARAYTALGRHDEAEKVLSNLAEQEAQAALALVERARLAQQQSGIDAALQVFEASDLDLTDPANQLALAALVDLAGMSGRDQHALERIARAVESHPEHAPFHSLQGRALQRHDSAGARAAFERALAIDTEDAAALQGLARVAASEGDLEKALALFDQASAGQPDDPLPGLLAAQSLLAAGRTEEAERRLRELVRRHPEHAGIANDLAWLLAEEGKDLDLALRLAEQASRLAPAPEVWDTLGWVYLQRGETDEALAALGRAVELWPGFATAQYHLGIALERSGRADAAREALQRALGSGPFPESDAARAQLARLEGSAGDRP